MVDVRDGIEQRQSPFQQQHLGGVIVAKEEGKEGAFVMLEMAAATAAAPGAYMDTKPSGFVSTSQQEQPYKMEMEDMSPGGVKMQPSVDGENDEYKGDLSGSGMKKRGRGRTLERELLAISASQSLVGWKPDEGGSKRARRPPARFVEATPQDYQEELLVQQALQNSKIETRLLDTPMDLPEVKTYRPSPEEFRDPIRYIESIRPEAELFGVAKIIPPQGWQPPPGLDMSMSHTFPTRRQRLRKFREGIGYGEGRYYTFQTYRRMADEFKAAWVHSRSTSKGLPEPSLEDLEKEYWRMVETASEDVVVEYGNDLDTLTYGSGFPRRPDLHDASGNISTSTLGPSGEDDDLSRADYYSNCGWNLNNLPFWPGSVLRYIRAPIKGVNVPWLYMGMLFATFCWHNEDNFLYSVNYLHEGAPKQWYAVPGSKAEALERTMKGFLKENFKESPDLLHHMTTLFSPMLLQRSGVPVYRAIQEAGQFIVTFPKSFHAGFSYGFNCAEAVNFSSIDWVRFGREAIDRYRRFGRPSVFSHERLVLTLAHHLGEESWSLKALKGLVDDLRRIVEEEESHRKRLRERGVRFNVVERCRLAANNLHSLDSSGLNYDDQRVCVACRQTCFLSAVACECNMEKVACVLEHDSVLCGCPGEKKYVIEWNEMHELRSLLQRLQEHYLHNKAALEASSSRIVTTTGVSRCYL